MPLSEDEQRILHEIERGFYRDDPHSAQRIERTSLPRYLANNCKLAILGFLIGLVVLVVGFATNWVLGLVGFAVMTASAIALAHNLRRIGRHGWQQLSAGLGTRSVSDRFTDTTDRMRRRFGQRD